MLNTKTDAALIVPPNLIVEEAVAALEMFQKSNDDPDLPGVFEITAPGIQACSEILLLSDRYRDVLPPEAQKIAEDRHAVVTACIAMLSNYITARDLRAKKRLH